MRWFLMAVLVGILGGCANMDVAECRTADWHAIGFEDGAEGRNPGYFGERRKACAKYGITAEFDSYSAGRDQGLAHFCTAHNGYRLGTQGYQYSGICPARLETAFLDAHTEGYGLYTRSAVVKRLDKRMRQSKKRAQEIEKLLTENVALLASSDAELKKRADIALTIRQLAEEKVLLEARLRQLEFDHAEAEREYERYQDHVAAQPWN